MLPGDAPKETILPTLKPRITITLNEHQYAVLSSLSGLQKASMSSIVVDLLDTTLPVLERLADVLQNAVSAPQNVLDEIRRTAQIAERDIAQMGSPITGLLDELLVKTSGMETYRPRPSAAGTDSIPDAKPPTSNRGVRNAPPASENRSISSSKSRSSVDSNGRAKK
uniref:Uncharacterized protein n=1 Tax=uncultured prokaryote TaxID=198431 RepID=A0A0H5Q3H4_9ZZZZ|nr:hypothetical protein [uncultured prokaryote]